MVPRYHRRNEVVSPLQPHPKNPAALEKEKLVELIRILWWNTVGGEANNTKGGAQKDPMPLGAAPGFSSRSVNKRGPATETAGGGGYTTVGRGVMKTYSRHQEQQREGGKQQQGQQKGGRQQERAVAAAGVAGARCCLFQAVPCFQRQCVSEVLVPKPQEVPLTTTVLRGRFKTYSRNCTLYITS